MKTIKLLKIEPNANNNKFYNMVQKNDSEFEVNYGRVGTPGQKMTYPIVEWESKFREKTGPKKGYKDVTHLFAEQSSDSKSDGFDIKNRQILQLVNQLQSFAKSTVSANYNVTSDQVTMKQVEEAQDILDNLTTKKDVETINSLLVELYHVIPRKMGKVREHLLVKYSTNEFNEKISAEQDLLDVMKGQVSVSSTQKDKKTISLLDFGLEIKEITDSEIEHIKKMMGSEKGQFKKAFRVINQKTQKKFEAIKPKLYADTTTELWHGSRNENWWNILQQGLVLRPTNVQINGKMFGQGVYYANKAKKSMGYCSLHNSYWAKGNSKTAYLSIYDVIVGKQLEVKRHEYWMSSLNDKKLKEKGNYDSLYAKGGYDLYNDEFIIYNHDQSTIKYIVEIG